MIRPSATGLATAFFRFYLLDALALGPARPATLLASVSAERLPFASGAFSRALQSLLEGGYLVPAPEAAIALTPLGAAERLAERDRWSAVVPTVLRLLGDVGPRPAPVVVEAPSPTSRVAPVAEAYLDRVLVSTVRERLAAARDGGPPFAVVLGVLDVETASEANRRSMVHRAIRAMLGSSATLLGGDVSAYRYGESGIAVIAPSEADGRRGDRLAALVRTRLDELMGTMTTSVRAFGGTRWQARAGAATWSSAIATSGALLRLAEEALRADLRRGPGPKIGAVA